MHELVSAESFDLEKTYEYILSIQLSLGGFSFSAKLQDDNKIMACKFVPLKISSNAVIHRHFSEWVKSEELLHRPYKKLRVIVLSEFFTLIPEIYFNEQLKNHIPEILFGNNSGFELAENIIHSLNSKLVFTLPPEINKTIQKEIGECEIVHPVKLLINNLPEIQSENGLVIFLDVENFYVVLFNHETVLLTNNFQMATANDILYYSLNILKQTGLSVQNTHLFITNINSLINNFEETMKTAFPEITYLDTETDFAGSKQTIQYIHRCK